MITGFFNIYPPFVCRFLRFSAVLVKLIPDWKGFIFDIHPTYHDVKFKEIIH